MFCKRGRYISEVKLFAERELILPVEDRTAFSIGLFAGAQQMDDHFVLLVHDQLTAIILDLELAFESVAVYLIT